MKKMEVSTIVQKLAFLEKRKAQIDEVIREVLSKHTAGFEWAPYQSSKIEFEVKESHRLENAIDAEELSLIRAKADLGRLAMRRKSLETLREKREAEFNIEENRRIQAEIDEAFRLMQPNAEFVPKED